MTSEERREARYLRRKAKRERNKAIRAEGAGTLEEVFSFKDAFKLGKKCCNGVRWKQSTQNFEARLLSRTAENRRRILDGTWKPRPYYSFALTERGKRRDIDAPRIADRQVHKVLANKVLWKIYLPYMIRNNGASIKGKGLSFAYGELERDLKRHCRLYGTAGQIVLLDFKGFFPNAPHDEARRRHERLIRNADLVKMLEAAERLTPKGRGLALGVELNQAEMIAMPSRVDCFIKCQLSLKGVGHYMDDYYILVPPDRDGKEILTAVTEKARECGFEVNARKAKVKPLSVPFRFCKTKFSLTATGKVEKTACRDGLKRIRRRLNSFKARTAEGSSTFERVRGSIQAATSYYAKGNNHGRWLKARRIFYAIYGFDSSDTAEFRRRDYEIHRSRTLQG